MCSGYRYTCAAVKLATGLSVPRTETPVKFFSFCLLMLAFGTSANQVELATLFPDALALGMEIRVKVGAPNHDHF